MIKQSVHQSDLIEDKMEINYNNLIWYEIKKISKDKKVKEYNQMLKII